MGNNLKEIAEKMAEASPDTTMVYVDALGNNRVAVKDGDGGDDAGIYYAALCIGARRARGGQIDGEEINILVQRAKESDISDPMPFIKRAIEQGEMLVRDE
jgi:hypothetical protein